MGYGGVKTGSSLAPEGKTEAGLNSRFLRQGFLGEDSDLGLRPASGRHHGHIRAYQFHLHHSRRFYSHLRGGLRAERRRGFPYARRAFAVGDTRFPQNDKMLRIAVE